ncbi:hypothetical protein GJ631_00325 [Natronomonas sp. CBA1123]|uniref:HEAT repeat domain-containing protein n=1 Tax=Natronomonas sp. CBA1123 TaxID=2668070 RepID=UPI0012EA08E5|nr:HEAT repeat domain-containing protein [Natronomonas sp. CBA1123]MUV85066.1 hypothetical protein [Natronomonas sp. CBA1123]
MGDASDPAPSDDVVDRLERGEVEAATASLDELQAADAEARTEAIRSLQRFAEEAPESFEPIVSALAPFLTDEQRSIRLSTAKLFVAVARTAPEAALGGADALAARLADDEEFYYVRARSAEALGYLALEAPEEVVSPDVLADLRVGLEFDEPEVREKLAKALAQVAVASPGRLRHHVPTLAAHLEDDSEEIRYHLATALVAVSCRKPEAVTDAVEELSARLDDDSPYVRGRAAEAVGLVARAGTSAAIPELKLAAMVEAADDGDDDEAFAVERVRFALAAIEGADSEDFDEEIGSLAAVRERTDEIIEAMRRTDESTCPQCGLELPEGGPPMCPDCGSPR